MLVVVWRSLELNELMVNLQVVERSAKLVFFLIGDILSIVRYDCFVFDELAGHNPVLLRVEIKKFDGLCLACLDGEVYFSWWGVLTHLIIELWSEFKFIMINTLMPIV